MGSGGERDKQGIARFAIPARGFYLDEFVVVERPLGLERDGFGEPGIADAHHRLKRVSEPAQVPALAFREPGSCGGGGFFHRRIVRGKRWRGVQKAAIDG